MAMVAMAAQSETPFPADSESAEAKLQVTGITARR
jgi:hypothetical protein